MRARSIGVAVLLSLVACTTREVIEVEYPEHEGMKSAIIGRRYQGVLELAAVRLDPFTRTELLPLIENVESDITLYAVYYPRALAEMEIAEGPLTPTMDKVRARPIPEGAASIHRTVIAGGAAADWEERDALDEELDAFLFRAEEDLCPDYDISAFDTDTYDVYSATLKVDETTAIAFGSRTGVAWRVEETGISPWAGLGRINARAAWRAPNGEMWLGGAHEQLWRGTPDTGFTPVISMATTSTIQWMDGPRDASAPFELFAVALNGAFQRFDGTAWEVLRPPRNMSDNFRGGVIWLAPGEAIAVPPQLTTLDTTFYHYRGGHVEEGSYSTPLFGEATSLAWIEGYGALALTKFSKILEWRGTEFAERLVARVIPAPFALGRYRRGFAYATPGISFVEYHPLIGFCPQIDFATALLPNAIVPLGDGMVLTGQGQGSEKTPILYAKQKTGP